MYCTVRYSNIQANTDGYTKKDDKLGFFLISETCISNTI